MKKRSESFNKRIKKALWSEKYFGKNLKIGYFVRRVAIIFIVIAGLFATGEASAKLFGFSPWKYISSFLIWRMIYTNNATLIMAQHTSNLKDIALHDYIQATGYSYVRYYKMREKK